MVTPSRSNADAGCTVYPPYFSIVPGGLILEAYACIPDFAPEKTGHDFGFILCSSTEPRKSTLMARAPVAVTET
jgi:hypothetical protein